MTISERLRTTTVSLQELLDSPPTNPRVVMDEKTYISRYIIEYHLQRIATQVGFITLQEHDRPFTLKAFSLFNGSSIVDIYPSAPVSELSVVGSLFDLRNLVDYESGYLRLPNGYIFSNSATHLRTGKSVFPEAQSMWPGFARPRIIHISSTPEYVEAHGLPTEGQPDLPARVMTVVKYDVKPAK